MLYGVHVYARAKVVPDLALSRGERGLPGGTGHWVTARWSSWRPAAWPWPTSRWASSARPTSGSIGPPRRRRPRRRPRRARQLETWRGHGRARAGDAERDADHLERAVESATEHGRPAARCEALALLARRGRAAWRRRTGDEDLAPGRRRPRSKRKAPCHPARPPALGRPGGRRARPTSRWRGAPRRGRPGGCPALEVLMTRCARTRTSTILLPAAAGHPGGQDGRAASHGPSIPADPLSGIAQRRLTRTCGCDGFGVPWVASWPSWPARWRRFTR